MKAINKKHMKPEEFPVTERSGDHHDTDDDFKEKDTLLKLQDLAINEKDDLAADTTVDSGNEIRYDDGDDRWNDECVYDDGVPIDRGWALVVCAACFGVHILVVGGLKSFPVLFVEIRDRYDVSAREMSIAQGLCITLSMALGLGANILATKVTSRVVVSVGGLLSSIGFIFTAFIPNYNWIYVSYSLIVGVGFSLCYSPSIVMVGCHFRKYRSMANGLAVSGSGIGSFALPNLIRFLLKLYGLQGCILILGALMLNLFAFGLLLRPLSSYKIKKIHRISEKICEKCIGPNDVSRYHSNYSGCKENNSNCPNVDQRDDGNQYKEAGLIGEKVLRMDNIRALSISNVDIGSASLQSIPQMDITTDSQDRNTMVCCCTSNKVSRGYSPESQSSKKVKAPLFDSSLLHNSVFLVYATSCFLASMGYPNVFLMLPAHAEMIGLSRDMSALLLSIIGISDLVGRIFFGWFSDRQFFPKIYGFIGCMAISGVLNLILPSLNSFPAMAVYTALYGLFAGSYIALVAVILADALGTEKLGSSFGLNLLAMSASLLISPPICGLIRDETGSWTVAFIFSGITTIIGAALPLFMPCAQKREEAKERATKIDAVLL